MDLIDRYLAAIARRLPAAKADDIVAEIRDDLLNRLEAREDRLGRPLTRNEVADLIKEVGHPLVVASRYRGQQYLVGPDAFPFFLSALRLVALFLIVAFVVTATSRVVFDHADVTRTLLRSVGDLINSEMLAFGVLTFVFVILERTGFPAQYIAKWRPQELPEVKHKQPSPWNSAFEVAAGVYFILWWCGLVPFPGYYGGEQGLTITPDPIWTMVWWPVLALMVARLVYNIVQWLRPRWKLVRGVLSVATAVGALALLGIVYQAGHWLTMGGRLPQKDLADLDTSVNLGIHWAIIVVGAAWVWQCLKELWDLVTARPRIAA